MLGEEENKRVPAKVYAVSLRDNENVLKSTVLMVADIYAHTKSH